MLRWTVYVFLLLSVSGCHFQNSPIPNPQPDDEKVSPITASEGWLIVVEEQAERAGNGTFILLNDTRFWTSIKGWQYRFIDDDAHPEVDPYLEKVEIAKVKEPALLIMDTQGVVKKITELPKSKEEVSKLLGL